MHGELSDEVYVKIPEGVKVPECVIRDLCVSDQKTYEIVCKLQKSLYGLKQAGRVWNLAFVEFFAKLSFKKCDSDNSVFCATINGV